MRSAVQNKYKNQVEEEGEKKGSNNRPVTFDRSIDRTTLIAL